MRHRQLTFLLCLGTGIAAFLLFWVQPLFTKQLLPILGGVPGVWNTLLFLFQLMLLLGYGYSHALTRYIPLNRQLPLHSGLLLFSLLFLPIGLQTGSAPPASEAFPYGWLTLTTLIGVGIPFFMVATTAPLLQKWLTYTTHPDKETPYFLYAVSNAASFLALFAFPLLLEPNWGVQSQLSLWSWGYGLFAIICIACGWQARSHAVARKTKKAPIHSTSPALKNCGLWALLAFIASSLLHGISVFVANDIASIPLFWIIPLGLYLLSFAIPFSRLNVYSHEAVLRTMPFIVIVALVLPFWIDIAEYITHVFIHLVLFFVLCLLCHGELRKRAPKAEHLTVFYLSIAIGGALGGFFNAFIAPLVFNQITEYPLSIALACYLILAAARPEGSRKAVRIVMDVAIPVILFFAVLWAYKAHLHAENYLIKEGLMIVLMTIIGGTLLFSVRRPKRFALFFFLAWIAVSMTSPTNVYGVSGKTLWGKYGWKNELLYIDRNFYGIIRALHNKKLNTVEYYNGSVLHAVQSLGKISPSITYFIYQLMHDPAFGHKPIAIFGMGPGEMLQYAAPANRIDFFEINPAVPDLATQSGIFSFFEMFETREKNIILGDARLNIAAQPDGKYGLIFSTAFNSNTIPFHLATKEAFETYLQKLDDGGAILFIAPANFFDFSHMFASLAEELGLTVYKNTIITAGKRRINWFAFMRKEEAAKRDDMPWQRKTHSWFRLEPTSETLVWTDDYSSLISVLKAPEETRY